MPCPSPQACLPSAMLTKRYLPSPSHHPPCSHIVKVQPKHIAIHGVARLIHRRLAPATGLVAKGGTYVAAFRGQEGGERKQTANQTKRALRQKHAGKACIRSSWFTV